MQNRGPRRDFLKQEKRANAPWQLMAKRALVHGPPKGHVKRVTAPSPNAPAKTSAPSPLLLGCFSALGPFAIDLYLPAFPVITADLQASAGQVQLSLVVFFASLAAGQLFYGPLSDAIGRKPPLIGGMALFFLASLGCAFAPNIATLIGLRIVQGLGACSGSIMARAIVRDHHSGPAAARTLSQMMLVFGVSPLFAPMAGSLLMGLGGWRAIFIAVAGLVAVALCITIFTLRESLPPQRRTRLSMGGMMGTYRELLRDRRLVGLTLTTSAWSGSTFTFLATSSFVYAHQFHFSPFGYGLMFSFCASGMIIASQFNARLMRTLGARRQLALVSTVAVACASLMAGLAIAGFGSAPVIMAGTFGLFACQGLSLTPASVTALDSHPRTAGAAAALMGATQLACGAVISGLISALCAPTLQTLVLTQLGCMAAAAISVRLAFRGVRRVEL